jgi:hypothetical protein
VAPRISSADEDPSDILSVLAEFVFGSMLQDRLTATATPLAYQNGSGAHQYRSTAAGNPENAWILAWRTELCTRSATLSGKWRIPVGGDAYQIGEMVRQSPERAYDLDFFEDFAAKAGWRIP